MKRNDLLITIGTIAYSILFYKQLAGINFLLFNILITTLFVARQPSLLKSGRWWLIAAATLFTAYNIVAVGSLLAVISNIIMLLLLCAYSMSPASSIILNFFFSFYSVAGSLIFIILRMADPAFRQKKTEGPETEEPKKTGGLSWKKFLTFFLPFVLILIFFFIFRTANPVFKKFTDKINLDFISFSWIIFTLGGFLLLCGVFYQYRIKALDNWELNKPKFLVFSENQKVLKWINERNAALFLFGMLDLMLLFINGTDVHFLYMGAKLPEGISHSDFVHNGVGMLILSIIIAVSLIMFFFRGNMNFEKNSVALKYVVYLWIAQNIFMVISTILRNNIYVGEFNLTYKRIGVYIYLVLTIAGLMTTFIKVLNKRTNWFLVRSNALAGVMLMTGCTAIDFDKVITDYNIGHAKSIAQLDKSYLISLSESNIPALYKICSNDSFDNNEGHHYTRFFRFSDFEGSNYGGNRRELDKKMFSFLNDCYGKDWRSWNRRRQTICDELVLLNKEGKIRELDFFNSGITDVKPLGLLKHLKSLKMASTYYANWKDLEVFKELEELDMRSNALTTLDSLCSLKSLKALELSDNDIANFKSLNKFPSLQRLSYIGAKQEKFKDFPSMPELKQLDLNSGNFAQLSFLKNQPSLQQLNLASCSSANGIPQLPRLKMLDISGSSFARGNELKKTLMAVPGLEELNISSNELTELSALSYQNPDKTFSPVFPGLTVLNAQNNFLSIAENIYLFTALRTLDLSKNRLSYAPNVQNLQQLRVLNLADNNISDLSPLAKSVNLHELNLSSNVQIKDFSALSALTSLRKLNLQGDFFSHLNYLSAMKELKELNIGGTYVENLKGIEQLSSLEDLIAETVLQSDINYLKNLKKLKHLHVYKIHPDVKQKLEQQLPGVNITCADVSEVHKRN